MEEYKSNSFKSREQQQEEPKQKLEPIVTSGAKIKKKSKTSEFFGQFISEDGEKVKSYIWTDVMVPAIKKTISDVVTNAIDMLLYGDTKSAYSKIPAEKVSWRTYYKSEERNSGGYVRPQVLPYTYDEIIVQTKGQADAVLNEMANAIQEYGFVSVASMYDLVGITNYAFTCNSYGWTDLRNAMIIRERDGYLLKMPKPMAID